MLFVRSIALLHHERRRSPAPDRRFQPTAARMRHSVSPRRLLCTDPSAAARNGCRWSHRDEGGNRRAADHNLHSALKITPDQDAKWKAVAQAMRENAAAMEKLEAETRKIPWQTMTAVDDLNMYQKFAQAHVDGLTNLIDDFKALYAVMPAAQKKNADAVFRSSGG